MQNRGDKVERVDPYRGGAPEKSGNNMKTMLIMFVLAAVVAWGIGQFWIMPNTLNSVSKLAFIAKMQQDITDANKDKLTLDALTKSQQTQTQAITDDINNRKFATQDALKDYVKTKDIPTAIDTSKMALKTDLTGLVSQADYDAKVKELQDQITALKGGSTVAPGTTGQVTVSIDSSTSAQFNGATPATVKVNINNGTNQYQYVNYFVTLSSVTTPTFAATNVTAQMSLMSYNVTIIPATGNTYQILLTPEGKMLVPPGVTSCYYLITILPSKAAVWQMSISSISASTTP